MKVINNFILFFIIILNPLVAKDDYRIEDQPAALQEALDIPTHGILKQKDNGFIYLDVSNEMINSVVPLLEMEGLLRPRPTASKSMGAHISVFDEKEAVSPEELGQPFPFTVKDIRSFTLRTRDGLKKLWTIATLSPELESLRKKYNCSSKLKGYDYHITLGKQMPTAPEGWEEKDSLSIHEFSDIPTEGLSAIGDFITVDSPKLLDTARRVDHVAQLTLKSNGFVYLNVDNQFIDTIKEELPVQGKFTPLSTSLKKMGAHISVIYEDEMIKKEIFNLIEAGDYFSFEVKELRYVERKSDNGVNRLWLLAVESPGLERLRKDYGLKSKLQGHDFHITLGTESISFDEIEELDAA